RRDVQPVLLGGAIAALGAVAGLAVLAATPGALPAVIASARHNFEGWNVSTIVLPASSWIRVDAWALFGRFAGGDLDLPAKLATTMGILGLSGLALWRLRGRTPAERHVALAITC